LRATLRAHDRRVRRGSAVSAGGTAPGPRPIEDFRPYLKLIARAHIPPWARRHVDESDAVQETLLEAHRARDAFRGATTGEQAAWLRQILARNLADAIRALRRMRRDVAREQPIDELAQRSSARLEEWLATECTGQPAARRRDRAPARRTT
jgi:RNA polymerase sigma-70 factor, ECF subfamily